MAPSKKQSQEIEREAEDVVSALKERGYSRFIDDGSGIASAVASRVLARCQGFDLLVKEPTYRGDGEYEFRSASHLGTKTADSTV